MNFDPETGEPLGPQAPMNFDPETGEPINTQNS
jgi:hypothetical protein